MRALLAVVSGSLAAIVVYWCGAVVALLAMRGIPLGSPGGPPTTNEIAIHLALGVTGSCLGSLLALRLAGSGQPLPALATGLLLATVAAVGFSQPASNWPPWFGLTMAAACLGGAAIGVMVATGRR